MSGPKVVRIVTREELIAVCAGHLARVEAAISEWTRIGRRNDCVSEAEIAACQARLQDLKGLLNRDRFMDLQKQSLEEIAFLQRDMQTRLNRVAAEAAKARSAQRRQAEAAAALVTALQARGRAVSDDLGARLRAVSEGRSDASALSEGFSLLSSATDPGADDRRRALADRLKGEEGDRSFAAWIAALPPAPDDAAIARLEQQIASFATLADADEAATYDARLTAAIEAAPPRRGLLLDSLELDLGRALADHRRRAELAETLALLIAEVAETDPDAASHLAAQARTSGADIAELATLAQETLRSRREAQAAAGRREAVLQSLSELGYEVGEGLSTAWVQDGRVVLRRPSQPGYGVEISGDPSAARMQMRVVAFEGAGPVDAVRDRDAETLWCGDVEALERGLAAKGGGLAIERALPVGAAPVRRVAAPTGTKSEAAREGPAIGLRSRDLKS